MAGKRFSVPVLFTYAAEPKNVWIECSETERRVLPKGWTRDPGRRALPVDMIWEKDVRIAMRDGVSLLADFFRPVTSDERAVPAIMPWSPFGKTGSGSLGLDMLPWRIGIPRAATSGLEKWEAPDPAEWIPRGYAVVNIDARGAYKSEGDLFIYGTQEGRDGHDSIEWIAEQSWCNGAVTMAGNSWLGTTQWLIAAEQPPHLACMAPWEGLGDYYRESICRGGIPDHSFWDLLFGLFGGEHKREDVSAMVDKYSLWNDYWEDKKPQLRKITVPMYATASYSTALHTEGSLRGFFLSSSREKWLRWTPTQEWHDIYQPKHIDELQLFFDKYMLEVDNGWEQTPLIRLSLLGYNRPSVVDRPVPTYPPPDFRYQTMYLDADNAKLCGEPAAIESRGSYDATVGYDPALENQQSCTFTHTFETYTELCGVSRVKLFMSTPDADDMDVYVVIRKLNAAGEPLYHYNIPFSALPPDTKTEDIPHENVWKYVGPNGRLRASNRAVIDEQLSGLSGEQYKELMSDAYVYHSYDDNRKLAQGEVVELDIGLWAGGMIFDAGESMRLEVQGVRPILPEFVGLVDKNHNRGTHTVHTGGKYASSLYVSLSSKPPGRQ